MAERVPYFQHNAGVFGVIGAFFLSIGAFGLGNTAVHNFQLIDLGAEDTQASIRNCDSDGNPACDLTQEISGVEESKKDEPYSKGDIGAAVGGAIGIGGSIYIYYRRPEEDAAGPRASRSHY
jgi:hypothetical protein